MGGLSEAFSKAIRDNGIFAGQVWLIPDRLLTFADHDPAKRTTHPHRPVIVMQGDDRGRNAECQTILVVPLSSDTSRQRPWEDILSVSETPLDKPSIVKVQLIQPIPRAALEGECTFVGDVDPAALDRIFVHLVTNLGLLE